MICMLIQAFEGREIGIVSHDKAPQLITPVESDMDRKFQKKSPGYFPIMPT
jgi:hypothetical protein